MKNKTLTFYGKLAFDKLDPALYDDTVGRIDSLLLVYYNLCTVQYMYLFLSQDFPIRSLFSVTKVSLPNTCCFSSTYNNL